MVLLCVRTDSKVLSFVADKDPLKRHSEYAWDGTPMDLINCHDTLIFRTVKVTSHALLLNSICDGELQVGADRKNTMQPARNALACKVILESMLDTFMFRTKT